MDSSNGSATTTLMLGLVVDNNILGVSCSKEELEVEMELEEEEEEEKEE